MKHKAVVVIVGPTGIGKTEVVLELAHKYKSAIVSADSRQIYKEIKIGTAAPTEEEMESVPHYLIGVKSVLDYYSAYEFEQDALKIVNNLFKSHNLIFMAGGSMMYIDAFCNGIDDLPTVDEKLRAEVAEEYKKNGLEYMQRKLKLLDPTYYNQVDLKNHKRVIYAIEICLMTGKPYSQLRTKQKVERPFNIIKIGLNMEREKLYERINQRVDKMFDLGLVEEARSVYEFKEQNSLNTVGYKELFAYFDGKHSQERAKELIKRNSRHYAKKQLSWFNRDKFITWFHPSEISLIKEFIDKQIIL